MASMAAPLFTTALTGTVTLGGALSAAGTVMSLLGASNQADEMRAAAARNAENARITAEANKQQLDAAAGQQEAAGQHEAEAKRRKAELMLSRAQAVAAASGGGALDETIMAGILGEGEKDAGYSIYESTERAKSTRHRGDVGVYQANASGRNEIISANKKADATMLGAIGSAGISLAGRFAPKEMLTAGGSSYGFYDDWNVGG